MAPPFLDTNVILRHLLQDHADHSPRATGLIAQIDRGELQVQTTPIVVFEAVYTLSRAARASKESIREGVLEILDMPGVSLPRKQIMRRAFDLFVELNISFPDAYHAALFEGTDTTEVFSFDRDFDRVDWLERLEP